MVMDQEDQLALHKSKTAKIKPDVFGMMKTIAGERKPMSKVKRIAKSRPKKVKK